MLKRSPSGFRNRYLVLVALTWSLPPIVGLYVIYYIEILNYQQMYRVLASPLMQVFIVATILFALWYFHRLAKPVAGVLSEPRGEYAEEINRFLEKFPLHFWSHFLLYLLSAVVVTISSAELYSDFVARPVDWFRINLVAIIVSIIVGLPIFFLIYDLFGSTFAPIGLLRPVVTVKTRVFLIGALVPLLIDTMLVQYYWARTGFFSLETFFIWLFLELVAIAGALLFVHSFMQSLSPLQSLLHAPRGPEDLPSSYLVPASTDELGNISQGVRGLLEEQQIHRERLALSNQLLKVFQSSDEISDLLAVIIEKSRLRTGSELAFLAFFDEPKNALSVVIYTDADYKEEGHFQLPLDEASVFTEVFHTDGVLIIEDVSNHPCRNTQLARLLVAHGSVAGAHLSAAGNAIGVLLCVFDRNRHYFSQLDKSILNAFAQEAALVEIILRDLLEKKRAEHAVAKIMDGILPTMGEKFFPAVAMSMCEILGADVVSIGILSEESEDYIETLALFVDGKSCSNIRYTLRDTPCSSVIGRKKKRYTSNIHRLFPENRYIRDLGMEAYIGVPLFYSDGKPLGVQFAMFRRPVKNPVFVESVLGIFSVRTSAEIERTNNEAQIRHMAYHDSLTRLPNRALMFDRLRQAIAHAKRTGHYLAVMLLDIDHFKSINDTLGHPVGDELLIQVGSRLCDCIRHEDTVARIGGDEFVILLSDISNGQTALAHTSKVAEKIAKLFTRTFAVSANTLTVSASIGITLFPEDGDDPDMLIKNADTVMYQVKEHGRGHHLFFSASMNTEVSRRHHMFGDLRIALQDHQFHIVYQPKVFAPENRIIGAEALLRWIHPEKGSIPPREFIPIAEDTGLIIPLGNWVMEETCRFTTALHNQIDEGNRHFRISFNVSPFQFNQTDFIEKLKRIIERYGTPPTCLEIELTENVLIHDIDLVKDKLDDLKSLGVHISIDDFGTGYSSLRYLQQLPIDIIKIDRSFVKNIAVSQSNVAIIETIIAMARHMEIETIAEGVEDDEQISILMDRGC